MWEIVILLMTYLVKYVLQTKATMQQWQQSNNV